MFFVILCGVLGFLIAGGRSRRRFQRHLEFRQLIVIVSERGFGRDAASERTTIAVGSALEVTWDSGRAITVRSRIGFENFDMLDDELASRRRRRSGR